MRMKMLRRRACWNTRWRAKDIPASAEKWLLRTDVEYEGDSTFARLWGGFIFSAAPAARRYLAWVADA